MDGTNKGSNTKADVGGIEPSSCGIFLMLVLALEMLKVRSIRSNEKLAVMS